MNNSLTILQQSLTNHKPSADHINQALLDLEKSAKKSKENYQLQSLLGRWQLYFITGTKKAKQRAGIVLGKGFYLPSLININLTYSQEENQGLIMTNVVQIGLLSLTVSGCAKFFPQKNILAFDFTRISISFLGKNIYQGEIRGGKIKEEKFAQASLKNLPFFHYFYLSQNLICARGKGGGLAMWKLISK